MLANGITLSYKTSSGSSFTELEGLKEVPELNMNKEMVENTPLNAKNKQYEVGVGDLGDLTYTFKYDNTSSTSAYRILRNAMENDTLLTFQQKLPDGTTFTFDAYTSVGITGGAINGVIDVSATLAVNSDITVADPS